MRARLALSLLVSLIIGTAVFAGGGPKNVVVVRNTSSPLSKVIANYYTAARGIPPENICDIRCPTQEIISQQECLDMVVAPIRAFLQKPEIAGRIDYIVVTKGIPLGADYGYSSGHLSITSILTCVSEPTITQYIKNPYGPTAIVPVETSFSHKLVLDGMRFYLVTRLDGYTKQDVMRMIDGGLAAAPAGSVLIDRQVLGDTASSAYKTLNDRLHTASKILFSRGVSTIYDDTAEFVGGCSGLLGYFSWGSNDWAYNPIAYRSNGFAPGSIADTYVSTSARTFSPTTVGQSLIADLISSGACGVSGYVSEPYTAYSTYADVLFDRYTKGYNMAESFYAACPELYWKSVVVGDPLMAPFATPPTVSVDESSMHLTDTATISATAADDSGIHSVDFYFDGKFIGSATQPPYCVTLDTTQYVVGPHKVEVVATESGPVAAQATAIATVNVENPVSNLVSISDAYHSPDGQGVRITEKVVTAGTLEMGGGEFYVEDHTRAGGIRIVSSQILEEGDVVSIVGDLVTENGERSVAATEVQTDEHLLTRLAPVQMQNRAVGGGDVNDQTRGITGAVGLRNLGLLIKTWGRVTYVGGVDEPFFYIDDGSRLVDGSGHVGIKILSRGIPKPEIGRWVSVLGVSSCEQRDTSVVRVVKLRRPTDIKYIGQ
jgi:uncharacterized protein (TIGR03790 family)